MLVLLDVERGTLKKVAETGGGRKGRPKRGGRGEWRPGGTKAQGAETDGGRLSGRDD